jgi:hypothetical protein
MAACAFRQSLRVEHWVVAGRQGQTVARNILGKRERFTAVPFFWSAHFDVIICYLGHAVGWDAVEVDGSLERNDVTIVYRRAGRVLAIATIGRDRVSLAAEDAMDLGDWSKLETMLHARHSRHIATTGTRRFGSTMTYARPMLYSGT